MNLIVRHAVQAQGATQEEAILVDEASRRLPEAIRRQYYPAELARHYVIIIRSGG